MLTAQNLTKSYGDQVLFEDVGFVMTPGERLGLVGRNGSGKSTLFNLLLGVEESDSGSIVSPRGYRIGHLSQHLAFHEATILDEVCTSLGDRAEEEQHRAEAALMGLGFTKDDLRRPASEFSGGFQIRVNLARVLVEEPNLLLLDEPTNYLDIVSVRWLSRFLRRWRNELILITHDRQFMNSVTTHTMAIHRKRLRRMPGTVEKLFDQIATEEDIHENTRLNEAKKRARDERFIERFRSKASKASVVQSRIKALNKRGRMEVLENEQELAFRFNTAPFHATTMMTVTDLAFGYPGGPALIEGLDLSIEKGDRVAIIGANGKGKSTLLNLLAGELRFTKGEVKLNPNTRVALFGQTNVDRLHAAHTVEEELLAVDPTRGRTATRGLCGLLMFSGDAATKRIEVLSGGERSRVLLGKILVSPSNLLLLDEPTNHLDIESIEGMLDAIDAFPGGVLLVTHSEMILERLATRLVVFDGGRVTLFEGGYRDFLDRIGWQSEFDERRGGKPGSRRNARELRQLRAAIVTARGKVTGPLKKRIAKHEDRIHHLEQEVAEHDRLMADAAEAGRTDEMTRLATLAGRKRKSIDAEFAELERLSDELDRVRTEYDAKLAVLT
jgi:ATP-binding cassette subfamily F protein 3